MNSPVLIDTDILSQAIRRHRIVLANFRSYLATHGRFTISSMTKYEVLRGLKVKSAANQLARLEKFCVHNVVLPVTDSIILRATDIYVDLYRKGSLIGDADILIAATALEHGMALATNNVKHFENIAGLEIQNWLDMNS
jgi:tRNA(fMet)-specific endonuclease VapC